MKPLALIVSMILLLALNIAPVESQGHPDPTPTPTPTPTATPTPTPVGGVPACTDHNDTVWHGLVKRNTDQSINCSYGHTHMDNPADVDSIFGTLASIGLDGISYPWQTTNENQNKHRVYDWNVVTTSSCSGNPSGGKSFNAIRAEQHVDTNPGAVTRYHSYFFQARGCDPNDSNWTNGTIRFGGHLDTGCLRVQINAQGQQQYVPLTGDPSECLANERIHGTPDFFRGDMTWYGASLGVIGDGAVIPFNLGQRKEDWGPVDPDSPSTVLFYGGTQNGSFMEPMHSVSLLLGDDLPGYSGGYITGTFYVDRHLNVLSGSCSPVGPDCIPVVVNNMKVGSYAFRADTAGISTREYDITVNGQSLIVYPN